eukprot:TRINITY_DN12483_c0_g1_i6.p1 TRINITY_DN12483_c0_g1~~TRINITY_DN12483_c0_g1_i6.p1  ORF type:complete len:954 (-),score=189.63 TRINITY_DN12483_c0_g1_i6:91-2922(-)
MHLLVSKTLLLCLLVHWIKFSSGFSYLKAGVDLGETSLAFEEGSGDNLDVTIEALIEGSINNSCVENLKHEFDENLNKYVDLLGEGIHPDMKLYICDHGDIHVDYGDHNYIKDEAENSTEVIAVECLHPPSTVYPKYVTTEWNDIEAKVEISSTGSTKLYISTSNTTMNCSYLIDHHHHHANIILHPVFFTLEFSPNGQKLMYLAEALPNPALDWIRFSPNLGGNWKYIVKKPQLIVLDILSREITVHAVQNGHIAGKSLWNPDSTRIITVTRPLRYNPCPECTDHPTRLVQIDTVTGTLDYLSEHEDHVSFPALTPDTGSILYFKNKLQINHYEKVVPSSHNAPQSLFMISLEDGTVTVLVDEDIGLDGENGLYPDLVKPWPRRMFLEDGKRFIISCSISNNMYVIDIESKEVLQVEDHTGVVIDVLGDKILSLHKSPAHGERLRLGTLVDFEMTTSMATTEPATTTADVVTTVQDSTTKAIDVIVNETTEPEETKQITTPQTSLPLKKNDTLPDPCQELIDSLLAEMNKEEEKEDSSPAKLLEPTLPETTTHGDHTYETTKELEVIHETTTAHINTADHTLVPETSTLVTVYETTVEAHTDVPIKPLKGIKMETTNILTFGPIESVHGYSTTQKVGGGTSEIEITIAERHLNGTSHPNLLVYIGGMDGKTMPLHTMYIWIAAGWTVMQVHYRGLPTLFKNEHSIIGSSLEKEVDDCHQAVIAQISNLNYGEVLLMGVGMGGTIASNLAAKHPDTYGHMILVNPVLSLPSLIVARPNYLRRIFNPDSTWFTPVDVAKTWKASPLSQVGQIKTPVLMITTWDVLKTQAPMFDKKLRDHGITSDYYQLEQNMENKIKTVEMMVLWAEKHYQKYDNQCFVPAPPSTSTRGTTTRGTTTGQSSTSSTKEIKNQVDREMTTKPDSSSSKSFISFIIFTIALSFHLLM